MNWGVNRADILRVQSFIEATEVGKRLYERYGFVLVSIDTVDTNTPNPSEDWKDMDRRFKPIPWWVGQAWRDISRLLTVFDRYCMWRPVKGDYDEGKTILPW